MECNCANPDPNPWIDPAFSYGLLGWDYPNLCVGRVLGEAVHGEIAAYARSVKGEKLLTVDANVPDYFISLSGDGVVTVGGEFIGGVDYAGDCNWSAVNDYRGVDEFNVFVAHPGDPGDPNCGDHCDNPNHPYEEVGWLTVRLEQLQENARYRVYIRYATIPAATGGLGVAALIQERWDWDPPGNWILIDQDTPDYEVLRVMNDSEYIWEEREVYYGDAIVVGGEIEIVLDDGAHPPPDNPPFCTLKEAVLTGIRFDSVLYEAPEIAGDGFEGRDLCAWASKEPVDPVCRRFW